MLGPMPFVCHINVFNINYFTQKKLNVEMLAYKTEVFDTFMRQS